MEDLERKIVNNGNVFNQKVLIGIFKDVFTLNDASVKAPEFFEANMKEPEQQNSIVKTPEFVKLL